MVPRNFFINKIRELGYTYKTKQKRTTLWRKKGGTHFISVPLADLLEDGFVTSTLHQAGVKPGEILSFIASSKS